MTEATNEHAGLAGGDGDRSISRLDDNSNGSGVRVAGHSGGESSALIAMIERAARDPSVDIDKMERLFQMHERVEARRSVQAYNAAMSAAQEEMPAVVKNKQNDHTKARYADLFAIADECLPVIHKHGFGLSFSECKATEPNCMGIACRASHRDGHAENYTFNVPIDSAGSQGKVNKTITQAYGSTFTYGRRYATCGVFNIIITDKDGNSAGAATISQEQEDALRDKIEAVSADLPRFCKYFHIEKLPDLPAKDYDRAMKALEKRGNQ